MSVEMLASLITNAGLAVGLCVFFVVTGAKRERRQEQERAKREAQLNERLAANEDFVKNHFLTVVTNNTMAMNGMVAGFSAFAEVLKNQPCLAESSKKLEEIVSRMISAKT